MGDGRYYTYYQFFTTLILMVLMTASVISLVVSFYKTERKKKWLAYAIPLIGFTVLGMLKFVEGVMPSFAMAYFIRALSANITMAVILLVAINAGCCLLNLYVVNKTRTIVAVIVLSGVTLLLTFITNGDLLIQTYRFYNIQYSQIYQVYIALTFFMAIAGGLYVLFIGNDISPYYNNKQLMLIFGLLLILPKGIYLYTIFFSTAYVDMAEYVVMGAYITTINIMIHTETPYGLSSGAFERISDMVKDYVIVVNDRHEVIYRNRSAREALFLKAQSYLNPTKPETLFQGEAKLLKHTNNKNYIRLIQEDETFYYNFKTKALFDDEQCIGYILTFIDITKVLLMVDTLKSKRQQSAVLNEQLKNYSEVVYHVEKEKRIGAMINEIILNREAQVESLIKSIKDLDGASDVPYPERVNEVIEDNQHLLENVRQTVSLYRQRYGN